MIPMNWFSKIKFGGFASVAAVSLGISATGFIQVENATDSWLSLARLLGGGAVGIISIIAITRLIQALKNQPLDGQKVTAELLAVIQKLDIAITLMNTTTRVDHERMLKHDEDFMRRLEIVTGNEAIALSNHNKIIENQLTILRRGDEQHDAVIKQLDRMEADAKEERKNNHRES